MARLPQLMLTFALLGSIGAAQVAIPPSALEPLALGFAEGFVSDGPEVMMCGQLALGEVANLGEALKDLRTGITHLNLTEIEDAIKEFKDVVGGLPSAEKKCKTVVADLGSIIGTLKQMNGTKDLVFHIVDHMFDDSEKIFGELAAAEHAYKTGWDYMTAGQQLGMTVRRLLVGEGGDAPAPAPAPPAAKLEVFEGLAIGFISDNLDFMSCSLELRNETSDFGHAVKDFEDGLRHLNLTELKDAVEEFEMFVKGAAPTKATCKAATVAVESDVKTIVAALKAIHGTKDLVFKVIDNLFDDGEDIFGELSAASKAYRLAEYVGSGRQIGMALRRMLVGKTPPSPTPPSPPGPPSPSPPPSPPVPPPAPPAPPSPAHCDVGAAVHCPHLAADQMCAGNQCCPDGTTCPSADDTFASCPKPKVEDCTKMELLI